MRKDRIIEVVFISLMVIIFMIIMWRLGTKEVNAKDNQPTLKPVEVTAYYDAYGHGYGADGRKLIDGLTIAGRPQDLGKTALLYDEDLRLIGIYEFRDTGYGQPTGMGKSNIIKGQSIGTIENGSCVDIYMNTKSKCAQWGRRKCYLQIVDARG